MNNKKDNIYSDEVQEIMGEFPPKILHYGICIFSLVTFLFLASSIFFKYTTKISAECELVPQNPPIYLYAINKEKIKQLYIVSNQNVTKGEVLTLFDNNSNREQIIALEKILTKWVNNGSNITFINELFENPFDKLGDLQATYSECSKIWKSHLRHLQNEQIYSNELKEKVSKLYLAIIEWKKKYLLISPSSGKIIFMQNWKINQYVKPGEPIFAIIPNNISNLTVKAFLPMEKANKVNLNQHTTIYLNGFSKQEYGFLKGKITYISSIPDEQGNYIIEISLFNKNITSTGKKIPLQPKISGTAYIITEERNILQKLIQKQ